MPDGGACAARGGVTNGIATIADVEALERLPWDERGLPSDALALIEEGRARAGSEPALIYVPDATDHERHHVYSYSDLIAAIHEVASGLRTLTEGPPTVALLLPNLPETHFCLWGAQRAGRVLPINPLLEPSQVAELLKASGTDVVVTLGALPGTDLFARTLRALKGNDRVRTIVTVDASRHLRLPKRVAGAAASAVRTRGDRRILTMASLRRLGRRAGPVPPPEPRDTAALFHTGGTTGAPKLAQLTHRNLVGCAFMLSHGRFAKGSGTMGSSTEGLGRVFCALPLFHINAPILTGLATWRLGATVVLGPPTGYRADGLMDRLWTILDAYDVQAMSAVPTVYAAMLRDVPSPIPKALQHCFCGAAPLPRDVYDGFADRVGITLMEGYGFTESTAVVAVNPPCGARPHGAVGLRLPYQDLAILVREGEGWRHAASGEVGHVAARGPNLFAGYVGDEPTPRIADPDGGADWYDSGDLGRLDADGYLWLTGRAKDLIIRGGHNIDPRVIEDALASHPAVSVCAAIGSPDAHAGEVPIAFVELAEGASATEDALLSHARKSITERAAIPRRVFVTDALPLTAVGKVFKPPLRTMEAERIVREELRALSGDAFIDGFTDGKTAHRVVLVGSAEVEDTLRARLDRFILPFSVEVRRRDADVREEGGAEGVESG